MTAIVVVVLLGCAGDVCVWVEVRFGWMDCWCEGLSCGGWYDMYDGRSC